jgi:hypothetical protein
MLYTDGGYKQEEGVYGYKDGIEQRMKIRPSKPVNRAELVQYTMLSVLGKKAMT